MIPIRNLYNILLYAWDLLEQGETIDVSAGELDRPIDLLAYVLIQTAEPIIKQGLHHSYVREVQALSTIRGSIDFGATFSSGALSRRELVCETESLSSNIAHNQILKATLLQLATQPLSRRLRGDIVGLLGRMGSVDQIRLSSRVFSTAHLHRNNRRYALPLAICRMLFENSVVGEGLEVRSFASFLRNEVKMRKVFEAFIRNLLKRRLASRYKVGGKRIDWAGRAGYSADLSLLPTMNMDVVVETDLESLIIDTKYTAKTLDRRWTTDRFRSEHMYQIFAYVENYAAPRPDQKVSGMLLYPALEAEWEAKFLLRGRSFSVATLSLDAEWSEIERRVTELCVSSLD